MAGARCLRDGDGEPMLEWRPGRAMRNAARASTAENSRGDLGPVSRRWARDHVDWVMCGMQGVGGACDGSCRSGVGGCGADWSG